MVLFNQWVSSGPDWFGFALFLIGVICIITVAFEKSTSWGVVMILFGALLWPVFVLLNWQKTNYWFFFALAGFLIMYIF